MRNGARMSSPAGGSRRAPLQKLSGRHQRAAQLIAQGKSHVEVSREVGYGPAYWSRLKNESPLFQDRIEFYRLQEEHAWRNSRIASYAIGDHLEERFWQKLRRRKRRMSHIRALIRGANDMFRESDALQPLAAAANQRDQLRAATNSTRAHVGEADSPPELKIERGGSEHATAGPMSSVPLHKNRAPPGRIVAGVGQIDRSRPRPRPRVQAADGTSGRRRF